MYEIVFTQRWAPQTVHGTDPRAVAEVVARKARRQFGNPRVYFDPSSGQGWVRADGVAIDFTAAEVA